MFYTKEELIEIGFSSVGEDTRVSNKAVFHGIKNSSIGDCVRIDDLINQNFYKTTMYNLLLV